MVFCWTFILLSLTLDKVLIFLLSYLASLGQLLFFFDPNAITILSGLAYLSVLLQFF